MPVLTGLTSLQRVVLDDNNISYIPPPLIAALRALPRGLSMDNNPSRCTVVEYSNKIDCSCTLGVFHVDEGCNVPCPVTDTNVVQFVSCVPETALFVGDACLPPFVLLSDAPLDVECSLQPNGRTSAWRDKVTRDVVVPEQLCAADACFTCNCSSSSLSIDCRTQRLPPGLLVNLPIVTTRLDVSFTGIRQLAPFKAPLQEIYANDNAITSLQQSTFDNQFGVHLRLLDLSNNKLTTIFAGAFLFAPNVLTLCLDGNVLAYLPRFSLPTFVQHLSLACAKFAIAALVTIDDLPFLTNLRVLDVTGQQGIASRLSSLPGSLFGELVDLWSVNLTNIFFPAGRLPDAVGALRFVKEVVAENCNIVTLDNVWQSLDLITTLNLKRNPLQVIVPFFLQNMPNLRVFDTDASAVVCDYAASAPPAAPKACSCAPNAPPNFVAGPGFCSPRCDAHYSTTLLCVPAFVAGAACRIGCLEGGSAPLACLLNNTWGAPTPGGNLPCTPVLPSNMSSSASGSTTTVAVAAAVGGAAVVLALLAIAALTLRRKRANLHTRPLVDQFEQLMAAKIGSVFALAFAYRFTQAQLAESRTSFAALEVPRKNVALARLIGEGQGGHVHLAHLTPSNRVVAVKLQSTTPIRSASDLALISHTVEEVLQLEALFLHHLRHAHVVQVVAVVTRTLPTWLCMEYLCHGDLKSFLRVCRPTLRTPKMTMTEFDFVSILVQVCDALCFLEENSVVHRDIAARNVLVGENLHRDVKISDLGATRVLAQDQVYYRSTAQTHVPLKWMAPEAVQEAKYTSKSDVWSFGVLAFEVTSYAMTPYGALGGQELFAELARGFRLPRPAACSEDLYNAVMVPCWAWEAAERPAFSALAPVLQRLLHAAPATTPTGADSEAAGRIFPGLWAGSPIVVSTSGRQPHTAAAAVAGPSPHKSPHLRLHDYDDDTHGGTGANGRLGPGQPIAATGGPCENPAARVIDSAV